MFVDGRDINMEERYQRYKENRIRELAYFKWLDSGCEENKDLEFWLQAEGEYTAAEQVVSNWAWVVKYQ